MKEKMYNMFFGSTRRKILMIFLIVFLVIFIGGLLSINYVNDVITNHHIHPDTITVTNKIHGDSVLGEHYFVIDEKNKSYTIINHGDGYGKAMFDSIDINKTYRVTVKEPELTDINQHTHILQVYNDTY